MNQFYAIPILGIAGLAAIWIAAMCWRKKPKITVIAKDKDIFKPRYLRK